ncbi:MAG: sigma E protease regulator RseP [Moritella sp.]|uniref:sigma E protease regulator RseP n=1 Tax=unclassified Moritella TaxID=2637987 RepID=UPI0001568569|nr:MULTISPECIES: sigma E protease regulator RseP [unclassified Moritella]EDM69145.1 membrane-associated zinc metalloprotease, putative [Moritella sp. PE36]MBL1418760.1 sigma E protease regulator RseP [Moritella sp.]
MISSLWNLGAFIVALGILVAIHEFGHFWVARRCGVKVLRFSIGFGKTIWMRTGKDGTEYVIAMIPLGGFVKMLDSRVDDVPEELKSQSFNGKPVLARIAIVAAGPLANFALAIVAFWFMFMIGVPSVKPVIGEVAPHSVMAEAGVTNKAIITAIDGQAVQDWNDVSLKLIEHMGEPSMAMQLYLEDTNYTVSRQVDLREWQFDPERESPISSMGLTPYRPAVSLELAEVIKGSAGEKAGLLAGDKIIVVEQQPIDDWSVLVAIIQQSPDQVLAVTVLRNGQQLALNVIPTGKAGPDGELKGYLGVAPVVASYPEDYLVDIQYGILDSVQQSVARTWQLTALTFKMIGRLVTGDISLNNLSGPISIAKSAGASADYGLVYFLGFLALISINLGLMNLMPLPVLDGGHLVYYTFELITGRPVSEKIQEVGFKIGSVMIMLLTGIALFNDFARL